MHITYVIQSQRMASIEYHLLHILRTMQARGIDVDVLLIDQHGHASDFTLTNEKKSGVPVKVISHTRTYSLALLRHLKNALAKQKPDIVHTHGPLADAYGTIAAKQAGIKTIISTSYAIPDDADASRPFWQTTLQSQLYQRQNAVITPHVTAADSKHLHIPYGLDMEALRIGQGARDVFCAELGIPADKPLIGMFADLSAPEMIAMALRMLWEITVQQPDAQLLIVGETSQQGALEKLAQGYHINKRVHFVGGGAEIPALLKSLNILLIPQPVIDPTILILQTMALGPTILACECANTADLIDDGETGLLVPNSNSDHMLSSLSLLLGDPAFASQLASNAKLNLEGRYPFKRMIDSLIMCYEQHVR